MAEKLEVEVVTAEGRLFTGAVDFAVVPAAEGELGILPRHVPLVATMKPGAVRLRVDGNDELIFVSGGFVEVAHVPEVSTSEGGSNQGRGAELGAAGASVTRVSVLADAGERAHDIDEARAQEARRRAQELLQQKLSQEGYAEAAGLLERSTARIRVAEVARRRRARREPQPPST